jgi:molybdate transport system substrate-binding protein
MKKAFSISSLALSLVLLLTVAATAADINLSAAASLKEAVSELCGSYAKRNSDIRFQNNFGASGALAKQIESGAPADVFFSANEEWMDYLKERKLVDGKSIATLAYNVLVFVGKPRVSAANIQDVIKMEKIAIGSPASVPAGDYAMQAFKKAGIDKQLEKKLVMAKDVRECLMYAERGEVDGAFVYKTDAEQMAKDVKILFTVPQELYSRITYPMGLTVAGSKKSEGVAFFEYLLSIEARAVLVRYGFIVR